MKKTMKKVIKRVIEKPQAKKTKQNGREYRIFAEWSYKPKG